MREPLIQNMRELARRGIDCASCRGECCTSRSNSMQITAMEADDILDDLRARGLLDDRLIEKIGATIKDFRLDVDLPAHGSRPNLRRTYTCPLFGEGPRGCMVSVEKKPLGCLAFNAIQPGASGLHSGCRSDQQLLSDGNPPNAPKAPIPMMLANRLGTNVQKA